MIPLLPYKAKAKTTARRKTFCETPLSLKHRIFYPLKNSLSILKFRNMRMFLKSRNMR